MGKRKKKQHTESGAGVLETGSLQDHTFPQLLHLPSLPYRISSLACGGAHVIALTSGGKVLTWGRGSSGQLDQGEVVSYALNPEPVTSLDDYFITHVSAGWSHSAFVSVDGHLYTWGRGFKGIVDVHSPQRLSSSLRFAKATLGWNHALALTGEEEGFMLGGNHLEVLTNPPSLNSPVNIKEANLEKIPGLDGVKIVDIAAGAEHSALVTENRVIKTWGWGEHGQLGLGDTCDQTSPITVSLGCDLNEEESIRVFCGSGFTFAITMPCNCNPSLH